MLEYFCIILPVSVLAVAHLLRVRYLNQQLQESLVSATGARGSGERARANLLPRRRAGFSHSDTRGVDDHPLLLDGVAALINTDPGMKLVAEATSGIEALRQYVFN